MSSPLPSSDIRISGALQGGVLELRSLRVADVDVAQLDLSVLDSEERAQSDRLARAEDRLSYLVAHVLLRQLLSRQLRVEPQHVAYARRPCPVCGELHGRPELDQPSPPLHFSLSRGGGMVLIGIASAPIGVDLEPLPEPRTVAEVSEFLHPEERREISSATISERPGVFARLWTRKEAYLKATGRGVTHDLAAEYLGPSGWARSPPGWSVIDVPVAEGYIAAAAVAGPLSFEPTPRP